MWLTWANGLTAFRLLAIGPGVWAIVTGRWGLAALLFGLAVATDLADGPIARRFNHASRLGGLFDHSTDAVYVAAHLGALAWMDYLNGWLAPLVLLAFTQYVLDSRALAGAVLKTSFVGRHNGIAYFVLVGIVVIREAVGLAWPPLAWIAGLGWLLVATTLLSMLDRAWTLIRQRG
ncbi:MAG: CDP-alcohol phosphatidyltransferase family protein [Pseudomonadales bacterium]|jgi:cardiolipin synthase